MQSPIRSRAWQGWSSPNTPNSGRRPSDDTKGRRLFGCLTIRAVLVFLPLLSECAVDVDIALFHPLFGVTGRHGWIQWREAAARNQPVHERSASRDGDGTVQRRLVPACGENCIGIGLLYPGRVQHQRAHEEVLVKAAVLDRDERLRQVRREFLDRNGSPASLAAVGEERAVGGEKIAILGGRFGTASWSIGGSCAA